MPRASVDVLRLFPSACVLHQEMIGAPPAKVAAEVVFVGDGVNVVGVEPYGREIESAAGSFLGNSFVRQRRILEAGAGDSRLPCEVVWRPQRELLPQHQCRTCPPLIIARGFTEILGD